MLHDSSLPETRPNVYDFNSICSSIAAPGFGSTDKRIRFVDLEEDQSLEAKRQSKIQLSARRLLSLIKVNNAQGA